MGSTLLSAMALVVKRPPGVVLCGEQDWILSDVWLWPAVRRKRPYNAYCAPILHGGVVHVISTAIRSKEGAYIGPTIASKSHRKFWFKTLREPRQRTT